MADQQPGATTLAAIGAHCAGLPGATMDNPFGEDTDVHRVGEKIFALINTLEGGYVTLKALPEEVPGLIAHHSAARPGYHMSKRHWVTFDLAGNTPLDELLELLEESHRLVLESLTKKR